MGTTDAVCGHCGASGASLYANDGSRVCERCFAYDQVVKGELRVSQQDLGMVGTGEVDDLQKQARSIGLQEVVIATLATAGAVASFLHASREHPLGYLAGGLLAAVALAIGIQGIRTMRFAGKDAPEVMKKASLPPPPIPPSASRES